MNSADAPSTAIRIVTPVDDARGALHRLTTDQTFAGHRAPYLCPYPRPYPLRLGCRGCSCGLILGNDGHMGRLTHPRRESALRYQTSRSCRSP